MALVTGYNALTMTAVNPGRVRRPRSLWLVVLLLVAIGVANLALALDHARHADHYRALGVSYPPLLRAGWGLLWAIVLLTVAAGLVGRRPWARRGVMLAVSNYMALSVLWSIGFARADFARQRLPFQAALAAGAALAAWWVMRRQNVRAVFVTARHEQPEDIAESGPDDEDQP
ncbi:MAG: hypothetical protein Kow00106_02800 [Anaerolineae bacterium]